MFAYIKGSLEIKANTNKEIQKVVEVIQGMPGIRSISSYMNWNPYELFVSQILTN